MTDHGLTPEQAKYYADKRIIEDVVIPKLVKSLGNADGSAKNTAMAMGISSSSYDAIVGQPEVERMQERIYSCYIKIKEIMGYYIDSSPSNLHIVALWIIGSYLHESFSTFPYLFFNAQKGSAKTRTLGIVSNLAYKGRGKVQVGINERVLYRSEEGATLVLDECEQIGKKQKEELREYLNAGYKRGLTVSRSKKVKVRSQEGEEEKYVQEEFSPFRPIVMANIWGMEEVLGDRCITIILEKSNMPEFIKIIEDYSENPTFKEINRELNELKCSLCSVVTKKKYIHWWNNYIKNKYSTTLHTLTTETTQTTQTTLPDEFLEIFKDIDMTNIDGRNLELFLPLFITSLIISPQTFRDTLSFAHEIVQSRKTEELSESKDVSFIEFISTLNQNRFDYISIKVLTLKFREFLGDLDQEEQWLNDKWIGRALKRLNLATNKRRVARGVEVLLSVDKAKLKIKEYKQEPKDLNTNNNNTNNE